RGGGSATPLGWGSKAARKRVRLEATAHFFAGPRVGVRFVEQSDADDADVANVVIFFSGVRFAHRTEAKGRHCFRALPKSSTTSLRLGLTMYPRLRSEAGRPSVTSRPSTEAQFQDENRSGCAQQWNNADLLRQQRTSDPQQSSRAIFVRFDRAAQSSPMLRLGRAESGACAPTRPHPPSREFQRRHCNKWRRRQ